MVIDMSKYHDMFLSESREHLQAMGRLLVELEKSPADREGLDALFREAHSIKGMAASMGYRATAELGHHLEDFLAGIRADGRIPPEAINRLLAGVDLLEGLIDDLAAALPERDVYAFIAGSGTVQPSVAPVPQEPDSGFQEGKPVPAASSEEILKIVVELVLEAVAPAARALLMLRELAGQGAVLDADPDEGQLMQGGAVPRLELRLKSRRTPQEVKDLLLDMPDVARVSCVVERVRSEARPNRERTVRVRTGLLDQFINLTGELVTNRYMLQAAYNEGRDQDLREGLERLTRLITDLHHHVLQARMMPLASITGRLPRMVRELEQQTDKAIALRIVGEEVELDRSILEALADPLMHLVRNAVDHGIEERGEIQIRAGREKDLVLVEVRDDGRGLDAEAIRRKAVAAGLLSPGQARGMAERDLFPLICLPGFSTRAEVSETSGRGVGMDVVKAVTEQFGGTLQIASERGQGTSIQLRLPLSVAIIRLLLVECGGELLALPITRVLRILELTRSEVRSSGRQMVVPLDNELVPLLSLRRMLRQPAQPVAGTIPVVVSEVRGRKIALVVDRLVGQREAFVKTLAFPLNRIAGVSGATILGDGRIVFIIDPQGLLDEGTAPGGRSGVTP